MYAHVWFLEAEPDKHPVIIKSRIGISGPLEIIGAFNGARRCRPYGRSDLRQIAMRLFGTPCYVFIHFTSLGFCHGCDLRSGSGNGSHIPHDFSSFFIIHFTPGKQHNRRFPQTSMSHAFSIRRLRVSGCLAVVIEKIQSRRASGVMSSHPARANGAAARALRRSIGTLISGSSPARVISTVTVSTASAPAASRIVLLTLSQ